MKPSITSIGTATPTYKRQQLAAAEIVINALQLGPVEKRLLKSIYRSTGIEYRHSVISDFCKEPGEYEFFPNDMSQPFPSTAARMRMYAEHALPLALQAIEQCFTAHAEIDKKQITHVITVSCTGMYAPGLDIEIVHALQLNSSVERTCINFMGCYGTFNALKVANAICKATPAAKVLIVSVELCSLHFQKDNAMDSIFSNAIFADGAAALLVEVPAQNKKALAMLAFHNDLLPQHSKDMAWKIGDNGFDIILSTYVAQAVESGIAEFAQRLLNTQQLEFSEIDYYAIHPGGQKILKTCEKALALTEQDNRYSYGVLRQFGNMSSATVVFVLKALWDDASEDKQNKKVFSCAFGPGLTLESMLLQFV